VEATTTAATMMMMVTTAETLAMMTLSGCIRCVVRLAVTPSRSSTHRSIPGHGCDEAAFGGFGMRVRRRLQVSESQRAQVIRHGGEHEGQVVQ
jgi:hypothetical protein